MPSTVNDTLRSFNESDLSVRACRILFDAIPGIPPFQYYADLEGAAGRLGIADVGAFRPDLEAIVLSNRTNRAISTAKKLDIADAALATYSGVANIFAWVSGSVGRQRMFDADRQQAIDAGLKILGTAYMATQVFEGTVPEKMKSFAKLPAGREMLLYLCVAELALPFLDQVIEKGWDFARSRLGEVSGDVDAKAAQALGGTDLSEAKMAAAEMGGMLESTTASLRGHFGAIASKLTSAMPGIVNVTGSAASATATALDAFPIWTLLGTRLAAEAAVQRASGASAPQALTVSV